LQTLKLFFITVASFPQQWGDSNKKFFLVAAFEISQNAQLIII
jgi:hypothetical protein